MKNNHSSSLTLVPLSFLLVILFIFQSQFVDLGSGLGSEESSHRQRILVGNQIILFLEYINHIHRHLGIDPIDSSSVESLRLQKSLENLDFGAFLSFTIGSIELKAVRLCRLLKR